jgi:IS1 family transposase
MRLGVRVGQGCATLHDRMMRRLNVSLLEVDEVWSFVGKKQKRVTEEDDPSLGDEYAYLGIDATKKAIVSFAVGKRTAGTTQGFVSDLRMRIVNRPQVTSDGFEPYVEAVEKAFGSDVDFAQLIKEYESDLSARKAQHRYSPGRITASERRIVTGKPDPERICTSYVERQNLTLRMQQRRFTRLTNAFSKKPENHRAAVALYAAWYNLCRVHETLRMTPAMAIGVADHVWSVAELVEAALALPPTAGPMVPPTPVDDGPQPMSRAAVGGAVLAYNAGRPTLKVIRGGRM